MSWKCNNNRERHSSEVKLQFLFLKLNFYKNYGNKSIDFWKRVIYSR